MKIVILTDYMNYLRQHLNKSSMDKELIKKIFLKRNIQCLEYFYDIAKKYYYKHLIKDDQLIKKQFHKRLGRDVELSCPIKYNDKIQWLKLYWRDPIAEICADKFAVREYVKEKIGEAYLNELIAVYDSVNDININTLPDKFVLKGTHGSGFNLICRDKYSVDWARQFILMKRWLNINYYWQNREPVYKNIKPRIICEKYLEQDDSNELRDYRFFCFSGEPKFITVDFSITDKKRTRRNLYDLEWNLMPAEISYPRELSFEINKPEKLHEMIELSRKLSEGFPHARIDFYYIDRKIIFGEITFFHQSGMAKIYPDDFEIKMGDWLKLPSLNGVD